MISDDDDDIIRLAPLVKPHTQSITNLHLRSSKISLLAPYCIIKHASYCYSFNETTGAWFLTFRLK